LRFDQRRYLAVKDPCPVYDGRRWHLFGTGITAPHEFELLHALATDLQGPWQLLDPVDVAGIEGGCVAAPGVIADHDGLHMFLQTDYNALGGRIEHLVSTDDGETFRHQRTVLTSAAHIGEAGIYDPHPAVLWGRRFLVYSAFSVVGQPDIHLAVSESDGWDGPWHRLGPILRHEQVSCHNQIGACDYEWGLEGAQLVELPDRQVLLNAVCFLPGAPAGSRQRVFFALGDSPVGPFEVMGPVLTPAGGPVAGENGHASAVVVRDEIQLFLQQRPRGRGDWHYALATGRVADVVRRMTGEEIAA
jgi:hypothetical protein